MYVHVMENKVGELYALWRVVSVDAIGFVADMFDGKAARRKRERERDLGDGKEVVSTKHTAVSM